MKKNTGRARTGTRTAKTSDCPLCGLSYKDFMAYGRLGCPQCYNAFRIHLELYLDSRHGAKRYPEAHKKHAPAPSLPLESEDLQQALRTALAREDFERAAFLRDILKQRGAL